MILIYVGDEKETSELDIYIKPLPCHSLPIEGIPIGKNREQKVANTWNWQGGQVGRVIKLYKETVSQDLLTEIFTNSTQVL